jgi:hypothetical protein
MKCIDCASVLKAKYKYPVLGKRYGTLPGVVHVYWCNSCHKKYRFLEVNEEILKAWYQTWEERRQQWIQENSQLEQKIYWLSMPDRLDNRKLLKLRKALIALIEQTF